MLDMQVSLPDLLKAKGLRLADLARECEVNKATVTRWAQRSIPLTRVYQVEEKTGISRHQLRPDFFGESAQ
jgi:transcriptional regulator with XRE-family HTH domain